MSTIWVFDNIENKQNLYRRKNFMKMVCTLLKKHATNKIDFERKKMLPLTKMELESRQNSIQNSVLYLWKNIYKKAC